MKTTFLKIATLLFLITATTASFAATQDYTEMTWINHFSKIEVHGNVQLHLLSGEKTRVEMSGTYYDHNALVQVEDGVLRIACYRAERLNVWVTVNDLSALSAYDNVLVQTEGKFSALQLDVNLFNKAKADLNLDCFCTNVKLNDRSMADISGTAMESNLASNYAATLNSTNFIADEISSIRVAPKWETRIEFIGFSDTELLSALPADTQQGLRFFSASGSPLNFDIPVGVQSINITQSRSTN